MFYMSFSFILEKVRMHEFKGKYVFEFLILFEEIRSHFFEFIWKESIFYSFEYIWNLKWNIFYFLNLFEIKYDINLDFSIFGR